MKKLYTFAAFMALTAGAFAQITVDTTCIVPQYMEGKSGTNNDRVPFYFWGSISGLTPNATYRYYTSMDTLNSSNGSNGAGNSYFVNMSSGTIRRTTNPSVAIAGGYDSLTANSSGVYAGWFGVESTGNGRYASGNLIHPQLQMNNGNGGTTVVTRLKFTSYMVTSVAMGVTAAPNFCSAIYDSASTAIAPPKSIVFLYDNISSAGRPLSSGIVESEGLAQNTISQIAAFYRNSVDSFPQRWGSIMPNINANGVRAVEYRDFATAAILVPNSINDNDGVWCSGANTVNPVNGTTGLYLDENFVLQGTMSFPSPVLTTFNVPFTANSNGSIGTQYTWDFGDGSPLNNTQNPLYAYSTPGTYTVTLTIQTPNCGIALTDTIVVILFTGTNELNAENTFTLAPNPSDGLFTFKTTASGTKAISVVNMLGETVFTSNTAAQQLDLDLRGEARGVYFVHMTNEKGERTTAKVVVR
jgi:hypothetical protein